MFEPQNVRIRSFEVVPSLPEPLQPLLEIAQNMGWCWHSEAADLFVRIDRELWHQSNHNPLWLLGRAPQSRLEQLADDESYLRLVRVAHQQMVEHMNHTGWFRRHHPDDTDVCVAYFCAEFGIAECFRNYSGGLGILAGDHLKSASGLGLPLIGVGLLYHKGYFQQYLNSDGWQQEALPELDFANQAVKPVAKADGSPLHVEVSLAGRNLTIAVWEMWVGRVRLLLLDTNIPENTPEDRKITAQLYGGDSENRIQQEIVLGIGGRRALAAMNIEPTVRHMNEGHAAFMALEHIRILIERHDVTFEEARTAGAGGNLFTTHTPVPAGIDRFDPVLVERYLAPYCEGLKTSLDSIMALGRQHHQPKEPFSMAVLALRTSDAANGVARLHGVVSRDMWSGMWPGTPIEEIPIGHVTNGVHVRTWLSHDLFYLLDRYLPIRWQSHPEDPKVWDAVDQVPDDDLWRVRQHRRQRLVRWVRGTQRKQLHRRGSGATDLEVASELFDPNALTIGFARRFATYKRANLLLRNPERLMKLLCDKDRPVQIVFAGKAHPADQQGKALIRDIVHFARENGATSRVVFIENYDMAVARHLVQGVDLWLNTPRRPMEASGTSGMKAAINGVLNCSIPDGWWDEVPRPNSGWTIGNGELYTDHDYQDEVESQSLYDLLEHEIVPAFYERDNQGLPRQWIKRMKASIRELAPRFNSHRMVRDYIESFYLPAHKRYQALTLNNLEPAKRLTEQMQLLRQRWHSVNIRRVEVKACEQVTVRQPLDITAEIHLGSEITPEDVLVQAYYGPMDHADRIHHGMVVDLQYAKALAEGHHQFTGKIVTADTGRYAFAVRVLPGLENLATPIISGMMTWEPSGAPDVHPISAGA